VIRKTGAKAEKMALAYTRCNGYVVRETGAKVERMAVGWELAPKWREWP
jgi:hypothetical protein